MRNSKLKLVLAASIVVAVGCESPTAAPVATRDLAVTGAPAFDARGSSNNGVTSTFTVTSRGGTFSVINGLFNVNFPAGSVCDPATSSYGVGHWDDPCTTISGGQSINVTARLVYANGTMSLDFSPELRFSPSSVVTISTDMYDGFLTAARSYYASHGGGISLGVQWFSDVGSGSVSDALSDPSVATHISWPSGRLWRRIKHFSGYVYSSGQPCDPSLGDPNCLPVNDGISQLGGM